MPGALWASPALTNAAVRSRVAQQVAIWLLPFGSLLATVRRQSATRHGLLASCPSAVSASLRRASVAHAHGKAIDDSTS
ncbi:MAG: hypothetical protein EOO15_22220, partial [Chitinophagaceae bacterium]